MIVVTAQRGGAFRETIAPVPWAEPAAAAAVREHHDPPSPADSSSEPGNETSPAGRMTSSAPVSLVTTPTPASDRAGPNGPALSSPT